MLKSASDTKAFWASSTLRSSISTYTVNVDRATCTVTQQEGERSQREKEMLMELQPFPIYSNNIHFSSQNIR